jgi:hypothetical protein
MTITNSEREVGYSVMEYSSCASRRIGDVASRSTQREGVSWVATPFGLASEATLHGWRPHLCNPTALSP